MGCREIIRSKCSSTRADYIYNRISGASLKKISESYASAQEFKEDLEKIKDSLLEKQIRVLISGEFAELLEATDVFGFYLASIDMRQDSSMKPVWQNC